MMGFLIFILCAVVGRFIGPELSAITGAAPLMNGQWVAGFTFLLMSGGWPIIPNNVRKELGLDKTAEKSARFRKGCTEWAKGQQEKAAKRIRCRNDDSIREENLAYIRDIQRQRMECAGRRCAPKPDHRWH